MARELTVYLNERTAGRLVQNDSGEIGFQYDELWLSDSQAVPLSQSLPLQKAPFSSRECRGFFGGVLPEGENRRIIARNLGITARNDVKMLEEIGGECAGAITFLASGESLIAKAGYYKSLTEPELASILRELPRRPLLAGTQHVRLSLAGAQDKLAVFVGDGQISLPQDDAPSTHILKPTIEGFPGIVHNELLCLRLAATIGLQVASSVLGSVEEIEYLLVERYDRIYVAQRPPTRLHQEDFCQALGIIPENKYQNEGGPSLRQCFQLLRDASSVPAVDINHLLDAVIYNFLIGNNDAHGKNFSLLYKKDTDGSWKTSFAPLYDLICTTDYPELSPNLAMKIGGEYESAKVRARHFDRMAEECGLGAPRVRRRIQTLARLVLSKLPRVTTNNSVSVGVAGVIRDRCERTILSLAVTLP